MLRTLHLVRHGEVWNPDHVVYADLPGFDLSARGRAQADEAAAFLAGSGAAVLVSSPLDRAVETAQPIASAVGLPIETDERLTEWRLSSRWSGVPWEELDEAFPGELTAYLDRPVDLPFTPETIVEAATRLASVVDDLGIRHPGGVAILVSHQDPVQAARLLLTGRPLEGLHSDKPDHGTVISLEPGSPWRETRRWDPPSAAAPFPPLPDPATEEDGLE